MAQDQHHGRRDEARARWSVCRHERIGERERKPVVGRVGIHHLTVPSLECAGPFGPSSAPAAARAGADVSPVSPEKAIALATMRVKKPRRGVTSVGSCICMSIYPSASSAPWRPHYPQDLRGRAEDVSRSSSTGKGRKKVIALACCARGKADRGEAFNQLVGDCEYFVWNCEVERLGCGAIDYQLSSAALPKAPPV